MSRTKGAHGKKSVNGNKNHMIKFRATDKMVKFLELAVDSFHGTKSRADIINDALLHHFRGGYFPGFPFSAQDVNEWLEP